VITDRLAVLDPLAPKTISFCRSSTGNETDALVQWSGTRTLQSTALTTRTSDYKNSAVLFSPKSTSVSTVANQGALPTQAEVYEYTGAYTYSTQKRGDQLSRIRIEEWESRAKRFVGVGSLRLLNKRRIFPKR
jgi:type VI secretion system secreted protein VgrG